MAVRVGGFADASGDGPAGQAEQSECWEIIGFAEFREARCFENPSPQDLKLVEQMQMSCYRKKVSEYEFPIAGIVSTCGMLERPVAVKLPSITRVRKQTMAVPEAVSQDILSSKVVGIGQALQEIVGPSCRRWLLWKCNDINATIMTAMQNQCQFKWPLFPAVARTLGLEVPDQPLPFTVAHTRPEGDAVNDEAESDITDDDDEEGGFVKKQTSPAATMLKFLRFRALLRPGSHLREALAIAADLLGCDVTKVQDPSTFRIPDNDTLRRGLVKVDCGLMLWSRHWWNHGYRAATCLLADSSEQSHYDFFCQRTDSLEIPPKLKLEDRVQLDETRHFRRSILPLGVLGYGETDIAHKVQVLVHTARLLTGSSSALDAWRHSIRGMCTDQGVERSLCDIPFIQDPALVNQVLDDYKANKVPMLGSEPNAFFFPKAVLITGPMHILWNAFEQCVKRTASWPFFQEILSAILAFLGHRGLRERFLQTCFDEGMPGERAVFYNWKHKVVDWKWEYMEEVFAKVSAAISLFLSRFDEQKIKKPIGHVEAADTIDPNCLSKITKAKGDDLKVAALTESYSVFAKAVGHEARWFTGCRCHDHIWKQSVSDLAKTRLFRKEMDGDIEECIWRGRRGSELARGYWRQMVV